MKSLVLGQKKNTMILCHVLGKHDFTVHREEKLEAVKYQVEMFKYDLIVIDSQNTCEIGAEKIQQLVDEHKNIVLYLYLYKPYEQILDKLGGYAFHGIIHESNDENELLLEVEKAKKHLIQRQNRSLVRVLMKMIYARDIETFHHVHRVAYYSQIITKGLKELETYKERISIDYINNIYWASQLHDIGKIGISDKVLFKPGKYTSEEYEEMKKHTEIGADIIQSLIEEYDHRDFLFMAKMIVNYHHEKWDGSGYPKGLKTYGIPLSARIVAIADVYDALVSERTYKKAMTHEAAKASIILESGKHFDPDIVEVFLKNEKSIVKLAKTDIDAKEDKYIH